MRANQRHMSCLTVTMAAVAFLSACGSPMLAVRAPQTEDRQKQS
jgi:hypothetical protein